jgi:hypothetical protein
MSFPTVTLVLSVRAREDAMAGRRCDVLDVREMLRRLRLGESARTIARDLGSSRNTVRGYASWFEDEGLLDAAAPLPTAEALSVRLAAVKCDAVRPSPRLLPYRHDVGALVGAGLEIKVAWQRFTAGHPDVRVSRPGLTSGRKHCERWKAALESTERAAWAARTIRPHASCSSESSTYLNQLICRGGR